MLYVLADRLDDDPWLLLLWRGRTRDELLAHLGRRGRGRAASEEIAPWWPLVPGAPLPVDTGHRDPWTDADPAAALARLGPLTLGAPGSVAPGSVGAQGALDERLRAAYVALVDAAPPDRTVEPI